MASSQSHNCIATRELRGTEVVVGAELDKIECVLSTTTSVPSSYREIRNATRNRRRPSANTPIRSVCAAVVGPQPSRGTSCRGEGGTALAQRCAGGQRRPTGRQADVDRFPARAAEGGRHGRGDLSGRRLQRVGHRPRRTRRSPSGSTRSAWRASCSNTAIGGEVTAIRPRCKMHSGQSARSALERPSGRSHPIGSASWDSPREGIWPRRPARISTRATPPRPTRSSESVAALIS